MRCGFTAQDMSAVSFVTLGRVPKHLFQDDRPAQKCSTTKRAVDERRKNKKKKKKNNFQHQPFVKRKKHLLAGRRNLKLKKRLVSRI